MRVHELQESISSKTTEMRGLVEAASSANRDLSDNEQARFDTLKGECTALEKRLANAQTVAELERRAGAQPVLVLQL